MRQPDKIPPKLRERKPAPPLPCEYCVSQLTAQVAQSQGIEGIKKQPNLTGRQKRQQIRTDSRSRTETRTDGLQGTTDAISFPLTQKLKAVIKLSLT